jgi:hypothetical protein
MGLNFEKKYLQNFIDDYGLMVERPYDWDTTGDNDPGDSIGGTAFAYLAYEDKRLIDAIKKCYVYKKDSKGEYIEPFRHPSFINLTGYTNDMSRDHVIYTLGIMNYAGEKKFVKELAKKLRWKFNSKFQMTIDMWLWMKGIGGNPIAMFFYYIVEFIIMLISLVYNAVLYKIAKFGPELSQDIYKQANDKDRTNIQKKVMQIRYPFYAFCFSAFMNFTTKNNIGKFLLNKLYSLFIPKYNTYMKLLVGSKVSKEEVYVYKSMTGTRWTTILNNLNDRDVHIITDLKTLEDNVIDVDIIKTLYKKNNK